MAKKLEIPIPVKKALSWRTRRADYAAQKTTMEGVDLLYEPGDEPSITPKDVGRLVLASAAYYARDLYDKRRKAVQESREKFIKGTAAQHIGLRGVVARTLGGRNARNFRLNISANTDIRWDRDKLRGALGEWVSTVVGEETWLRIFINPDDEESDLPMNTDRAVHIAKLGFIAAGYSPEKVDEIVVPDIRLNVHEKLLNEMVQGGEVDVDGAGQAVINSFSITAMKPDPAG